MAFTVGQVMEVIEAGRNHAVEVLAGLRPPVEPPEMPEARLLKCMFARGAIEVMDAWDKEQ